MLTIGERHENGAAGGCAVHNPVGPAEEALEAPAASIELLADNLVLANRRAVSLIVFATSSDIRGHLIHPIRRVKCCTFCRSANGESQRRAGNQP